MFPVDDQVEGRNETMKYHLGPKHKKVGPPLVVERFKKKIYIYYH